MKSKTKKILLGCFGLIFIMFCSVIGIFLYIFSGIFDEVPGKLVVRLPDYQQLQSATDKIQVTLNLENNNEGVANNLAESIGLDTKSLENTDIENLDFGELLKKVDLAKAMEALSQPGALNGTLMFTKGEVNAFIDAALSAHQVNMEMSDSSANEEPVKIYDAFFKDGRFTVKFSVDSKMNTPFGKYCNIEVVFTPQVIDHHLKLDLYSTKVGSISLPVSSFESMINNQLSVYEQSEDGKTLLSIITSLKIEEESFELKYDLQKLSVFALEKLPQIKQISSSPDKTEAIMELFK